MAGTEFTSAKVRAVYLCTVRVACIISKVPFTGLLNIIYRHCLETRRSKVNETKLIAQTVAPVVTVQHISYTVCMYSLPFPRPLQAWPSPVGLLGKEGVLPVLHTALWCSIKNDVRL